jgi:hypothetical protein
LTLPSTLFIDKYPFSDPLFLAQHNLAALHSISGATDLEAPEWVVPAWGSASLLEIALPESEPERKDAGFTATIPLHLRYLAPANVSHIFLHVPWPAVFFSCPSASSGSKLAAAPFDRANLGYDGLMGSTGLPGSKGTSGANTIFYHVPPSPPGATPDADDGRAGSTLMVPVMDLRKTDWVEWGTMGAVLLGTIWLLYVLRRVVKKRGFGSGKSEKKN